MGCVEKMNIKKIRALLFLVVLSALILAFPLILYATEALVDDPEIFFDQNNLVKEGILFDTSIFGSNEIEIWEDPNVFRAHDGYYYMFFAGGIDATSWQFRKLWLFRSPNIDFTEGELIGPILDSPPANWENRRIRARNVLYDEENSRYVAVYDGNGISRSGGGALLCSRENFPYGPWIESPAW